MKYLILTLMLIFVSCSEEMDRELPESLRDLENVTIYPSNPEPELHVYFERETSFGETDEVKFRFPGNIGVGESGEVAISDISQGVIHIYNPDGSYLRSVGQRGDGPGDFTVIANVKFIDDRLYVYDPNSIRLTIFSTEDYSLLRTVSMEPNNLSDYEELYDYFVSGIFLRQDGTILTRHLQYSNQLSLDQLIEDPVLFYLMDENGEIAGKILEQRGRKNVSVMIDGENRRLWHDFLGSSLFDISDDDRLYTALSDDFAISLFNPDGTYRQAFYYPVTKRPLLIEDVLPDLRSEESRSVLQRVPDEQIPEYWPVLHQFFVDDEHRIWAARITENEEIYEWWVLRENGELLARFDWPRNDRIDRVKDGKMYVRETDESTGISQIVRYQITIGS